MPQRIHVITLAVADLERALGFYRDGLGLESPGVIGTEYVADEVNAAGAIATFALKGGVILALYPRTELAKDAGVPVGPPKTGEFSLGHAVASRGEVDAVLDRARAASCDSAGTGPSSSFAGGCLGGLRGYDRSVEFSRELRADVLSGDITVTFRLWRSPKVKAGGHYRVGPGLIEVESIELVPFASIDETDLELSGEADRESLRRRAAHAGPIHDDTLIYRIQFHIVD